MASTRPHVALVAFPFGTHAAPLFALARAIASAAPRAGVSFLSTARSLASLPALADDCRSLLLLPLPDGLPSPPPEGIEAIIRMFITALEEGSLQEGLAAAEAKHGALPVSCVVSDAMLWMAGEAAEAVHAKWVPLWTGGPSGLLAHMYTDRLREIIGAAASEDEQLLHCVTVLSAHFRICDLPEGIVFGDLDAPVETLLHRMASALPRAAAVILNTFQGLDPGIDADFSAKFPKVLPIGPLQLLAPPSPPTDRSCLLWLDGRRAPASVAYVSFGSFKSPPPAEMAALAAGLEASRAEFLWSLRGEARELLPPGFLERTRGRGLVVGWAPQPDVLRHPAVGAFVTHCGWNSVVESIAAGVPMVCRPFFADQRMNARSVSRVWGVGVAVDGGVMTEEGVVGALEAVLRGEDGQRMRAKGSELREAARRAVGEPKGSSMVNFKVLLELL